MPRNTHPRPVTKHDRGHIRAQRDRHISNRWRRAKRDGRLDYISAYVRGAAWNNPRRDEILDTNETKVARFLHDEGYPNYSDRTWGSNHLHPDVMTRLPRELVPLLSGLELPRAALNSLADRDRFYKYCRGCPECKPYRHKPGHRTRVARAVQEEIDAGLAAWEAGGLDEECGHRTSAVREPDLSYGWC